MPMTGIWEQRSTATAALKWAQFYQQIGTGALCQQCYELIYTNRTYTMKDELSQTV